MGVALYGPRCINRRVTQIFVENAIMGKESVLEGGGEDRLDFTYLDDLVAGIILVLSEKRALNQIFNLTYGESRTIRELASLIEKQFPGVKFEEGPWNKNVPHRGTLDISKARDILGYVPKSPLEDGMEQYIDWYRSIDFAEIVK